LSWNKDTVTDVVIFEHLYELSDGKLNLLGSSEELLNTNDLIRTNKKISNKNMPPQNTKIKSNKNGKKPFIKNNNNNQK
jgi:hypothetical protein